MTDFTRRRVLATGTTLAVSFASSDLLAQRKLRSGASDGEIKMAIQPYSGPLAPSAWPAWQPPLTST